MKKYEKDVVRNKEMVLRGGALMFLDALIIIISMAGALWIRFDFHFGDISQEFIETVHDYLPVNIIVTILIYLIFKLYTSLWRFAGAEEMKNVILAGILSTAVQTIGMKAGGFAIPRSYPFLYLLLLVCLTVISRFSYRFLRLFYHHVQNMRKKKVMRTMIVGAGAAGYMIAREMKRSKHLNKKVCCIIDDSTSKIGTYLQGIPIVGGKEKIPYFAEKYEIEEIVIAIP